MRIQETVDTAGKWTSGNGNFFIFIIICLHLGWQNTLDIVTGAFLGTGYINRIFKKTWPHHLSLGIRRQTFGRPSVNCHNIGSVEAMSVSNPSHFEGWKEWTWRHQPGVYLALYVGKAKVTSHNTKRPTMCGQLFYNITKKEDPTLISWTQTKPTSFLGFGHRMDDWSRFTSRNMANCWWTFYGFRPYLFSRVCALLLIPSGKRGNLKSSFIDDIPSWKRPFLVETSIYSGFHWLSIVSHMCPIFFSSKHVFCRSWKRPLQHLKRGFHWELHGGEGGMWISGPHG